LRGSVVSRVSRDLRVGGKICRGRDCWLISKRIRMLHIRYCKIVAVLVAVLITGCASSKSRYATTAPPPPPIFLAPREIVNKPGYVEVNTSVITQSGSPIPSLKQADFVVDLAAAHPSIVFFSENACLPMSIGILIDSSGSMQPKLSTVNLGVADFISDLSPSDEVFLIAFTFQPYLLQPLTTDHQAVVQSLSKLRAFGQTSIYDSIISGVGVFGKGGNSKAILLITDGIDNSSMATERDAINWLKSDGVRIYTIGIGNRNIALGLEGEGALDGVDANALQDIARAAGGAVFIVPPMSQDKGKGFTAAIKEISGMLCDRYTIGITVPPSTSTSALRLTVANHPNAIVTPHIVNPSFP
jgi:VWFA-related protein